MDFGDGRIGKWTLEAKKAKVGFSEPQIPELAFGGSRSGKWLSGSKESKSHFWVFWPTDGDGKRQDYMASRP